MEYALIPIVIAIASCIFMFSKQLEEKKIINKKVIRTRPPKILTIFLLGTAFFLAGGGMALAIINKDDTKNLPLLILLISTFVFLSLFCYAWLRFNHVAVDDEKVVVYRLFLKKKTYRFEEIAFFMDTTQQGMSGGLICYNKDMKKLFAVEAVHVGISLVIQRLKEKNVVEISKRTKLY